MSSYDIDPHTFQPAFDGSDFCTVPGCLTHRVDHWLEDELRRALELSPQELWMEHRGWSA